MPLEVKFEY